MRFFALLLALCLPAPAADFDPRRDGFAFANETAYQYGLDDTGRLTMGPKAKPAEFKHRCLPMVRSTLQFWKFARFDAKAPRLSETDYRRKLRQLFRIPAWFSTKSAASRIVFPGYADLWSFSKAHQHLIQQEIGAWLPAYVRHGNWRMACPLTIFIQGWTARGTAKAVKREPQGIYVAKWPSLNHGVVVYAAQKEADGRTTFTVYDPNYPGKSARLTYDPKRGLFDFEKRFYWPGGEVRAFRIYDNPLH